MGSRCAGGGRVLNYSRVHDPDGRCDGVRVATGGYGVRGGKSEGGEGGEGGAPGGRACLPCTDATVCPHKFHGRIPVTPYGVSVRSTCTSNGTAHNSILGPWILGGNHRRESPFAASPWPTCPLTNHRRPVQCLPSHTLCRRCLEFLPAPSLVRLAVTYYCTYSRIPNSGTVRSSLAVPARLS
jgi:hypothetical protein